MITLPRLIQFNAVASAGKADAGIISGVSVITVGEASGHDVFVDAKTIETICACGNAFAGGVQVKEDHGSGFSSIVGALRNFRAEGDKAVADLHLLKSHDSYARIIEMSEMMPDAFGLSISFSGDIEDISGKSFVRVIELYSVDLVTQPAANPSGFFSKGGQVDTAHLIKQMHTWNLFTADAMITELSAKLAASEAEVASLKARPDELAAQFETAKAEVATLSKQRDEAVAAVVDFDAKVKAAADLKASEIMASFGVKPVALPPDASSANGSKTKTRAEFAAMNPEGQMAFVRSGGKIKD